MALRAVDEHALEQRRHAGRSRLVGQEEVGPSTGAQRDHSEAHQHVGFLDEGHRADRRAFARVEAQGPPSLQLAQAERGETGPIGALGQTQAHAKATGKGLGKGN